MMRDFTHRKGRELKENKSDITDEPKSMLRIMHTNVCLYIIPEWLCIYFKIQISSYTNLCFWDQVLSKTQIYVF